MVSIRDVRGKSVAELRAIMRRAREVMSRGPRARGYEDHSDLHLFAAVELGRRRARA